MTGVVEIHGWVPAGPLTAGDMPRIDLEAPFEISDGKLEIMAPPSMWHQETVKSIDRLLDPRYPATVSDVPVEVGKNGRRPDVLALRVGADELVRRRVQVLAADLIEVVVEVISHDADPWRDVVSVSRDRQVKMSEYARAGIPEYWIVDEDPVELTDAVIEIYHLVRGDYRLVLTARLSELRIDPAKIPSR